MFRSTRRAAVAKPYQLALEAANRHYARCHVGHYPQLAIFAFDHIGRRINLYGRYEKEILEATFEFLDHLGLGHGPMAVDVGANIGNHAVFFGERFDRVLAFEPNPRVFSLLQINAAGTNVEPVNVGVSDTRREHTLAIDQENLGASNIVLRGQGTTISVDRLDDLLAADSSRLALLKIDVEGHEAAVLHGGAERIARDRPVILFEQHAGDIVDGHSIAIDLLSGWNYDLYAASRNLYLGDSPIAKLLSSILRIPFGETFAFQCRRVFDGRFHEMIVAIPAECRLENP